MKSGLECIRLTEAWKKNPVGKVEDTPGFEEHRKELAAWREWYEGHKAVVDARERARAKLTEYHAAFQRAADAIREEEKHLKQLGDAAYFMKENEPRGYKQED